MKILVVDDSVIFRSQISQALRDVEGIEIVGVASNGKLALDKLDQISVDLVVLDIEMPVLDGLGTLKEIRARKHDVKVVMYSTLTSKGAEKTLDALSLGADDLAHKPTNEVIDIELIQESIREVLVPKILQFSSSPRTQSAVVTESTSSDGFKPEGIPASFFPGIAVLASSTGGPMALEEFFKHLKGMKFPFPLCLAQHMPPVFTGILAKRLAEVSGLEIKEAEHDEVLIPGQVYIAPGDYHLKVEKDEGKIIAKLNQAPVRNSVRPAADFLFESASKHFPGRLLGIVFTGMGEDGRDGCKAIKEVEGRVLIQDKASCVVFGMPGAVYEAKLYDGMGNLEYLATELKKIVK